MVDDAVELMAKAAYFRGIATFNRPVTLRLDVGQLCQFLVRDLLRCPRCQLPGELPLYPEQIMHVLARKRTDHEAPPGHGRHESLTTQRNETFADRSNAYPKRFSDGFHAQELAGPKIARHDLLTDITGHLIRQLFAS
jgi:hypothetical protein